MKRTTGILVLSLVLAACRGDRDRQLESRVLDEIGAAEDPLTVGVAVEGRVVRLTGVVASDAERTRLGDVARRVPGVLGVDNRLVVQEPVSTTGGVMSPEDEAARALKAAMEAKLISAGFPDLHVTVRGDVVYLHGTLPYGRHAEALRIARDAASPFTVDDETIVR